MVTKLKKENLKDYFQVNTRVNHVLIVLRKEKKIKFETQMQNHERH